MTAARIAGVPASLEAAAQAAAALLGGARLPVIAGLATDIAGVTAAIHLARRLRGVVDHAESAALLRDLDVMRRSGWIVTTPLEARARADLLVLAGAGLGPERGGLDVLLNSQGPTYFPGTARRVIRLCPGDGAPGPTGAQTIAGAPEELAATVRLIRMLVSGHEVAAPEPLKSCAAALHGARYGVIAWSASHSDDLAVETLCGLVETLNAKTRCAGLPLSPGGNAAGASQASAWLTGFPLPVGFGRGFAEHDPWRFDARRLAESGEADTALWIAALASAAPPWRRAMKLIALAPPEAAGESWVDRAEIVITVGRPGIEHDGVLHDARLAALAVRGASTPSPLPSVAEVLAAIMAAVPSC
jgi:formylmethanofuran dehydrogenase subunit B